MYSLIWLQNWIFFCFMSIIIKYHILHLIQYILSPKNPSPLAPTTHTPLPRYPVKKNKDNNIEKKRSYKTNSLEVWNFFCNWKVVFEVVEIYREFLNNLKNKFLFEIKLKINCTVLPCQNEQPKLLITNMRINVRKYPKYRKAWFLKTMW